MNLERFRYGVMYRLGFTPWDGHKLSAHLRELVEGRDPLPRGRALDIGCGTGDTSIYLAKHGFDVTALDFVQRAIDRASAKARAAGASVRFVHGDATKLTATGVGTGFPLVTDNGCLHGFSDEGRDAYVREVSQVVPSGGRLLILAFEEGRQRGVRGINRPDVERLFAPQWELLSSGQDEEASNHPDMPLIYYDLKRR